MDAPADLSPDLRPIVDLELSLGNSVQRVDRGAWSNCPLAVILRDPLHVADIHKKLSLPAGVHYWENHDPHYSLEAGFKCEKTRHSIAGPLPARGE